MRVFSKKSFTKVALHFGLALTFGLINIPDASANLAQAEIAKPAPQFSLPDNEGKMHTLADYKGKYVVLEWVNYDCPFVKKHYKSGNMPGLQTKYKSQDVVWISVCSSAKGKQGNFEKEALAAKIKKSKANPSLYLVDADGKVGKAFGAKTTPHMFIVDPLGNVIYNGAIDDKPSTDVEDVAGATNYVAQVLDAALAGKEIPVKSSKPYGCGVKYQ